MNRADAPSGKDCTCEDLAHDGDDELRPLVPNCLIQMEYKAREPFRNAVVPDEHKGPTAFSHYCLTYFVTPRRFASAV